jgi:hypothetical protein
VARPGSALMLAPVLRCGDTTVPLSVEPADLCIVVPKTR